MIAESLLVDFDKAIETAFAMIDGTNDNVNVPQTCQEAWNHPDPIEHELWRKAIRK